MNRVYEVAYVKLAQMLLPGEKMASSHEELFARCEERVRTLRALGGSPDVRVFGDEQTNLRAS